MSKKKTDMILKNHNKKVKEKLGSGKNSYVNDNTYRKSYSKNSEIRIICPKTGVLLKEITSKDKEFYGKVKTFNSNISRRSLYSDDEYLEDVNESVEVNEIVKSIIK